MAVNLPIKMFCILSEYLDRLWHAIFVDKLCQWMSCYKYSNKKFLNLFWNITFWEMSLHWRIRVVSWGTYLEVYSKKYLFIQKAYWNISRFVKALFEGHRPGNRRLGKLSTRIDTHLSYSLHVNTCSMSRTLHIYRLLKMNTIHVPSLFFCVCVFRASNCVHDHLQSPCAPGW